MPVREGGLFQACGEGVVIWAILRQHGRKIIIHVSSSKVPGASSAKTSSVGIAIYSTKTQQETFDKRGCCAIAKPRLRFPALGGHAE